ncbi:MAG: ABC transporter permease subunit [Sphaerochaeta sp.]
MKKLIILFIVLLLPFPFVFAADVSTFDSIEQFDGLTIGVQTAVLYEELIKDRVPNATFQYYTMPNDMILALNAGKVDAYLIEAVGYGVQKANHPELTTFREIPGYINASCIIGNNSKKARLLAELNEFIANGYKTGLLGNDGILYQYWIADFDPLTDNIGFKDFTFTGENGTVNVAVEGGYEPFSFVSDGKLAGFDVEFICRFCVEYGYTPVFNSVPFESIAPGVETGKFDIGMNIVISEERNETGTLSGVYYSCPVLLVIPGENTNTMSIFQQIQASFYKTFIRENRWKLFAEGAGVTLIITVCSILAGTVIGFAVYMACRHGNKLANRITNFFMWLIHGMPTVLLLMILYYIVFGKSRLSGMWVSVVGFSLMFACSMIDMLRVGYNAIGKGQSEASTALGYSDSQSFFRILLPQAANHFLPIYSNEVVTLIKETSVVGYIAVLDLTKISDLVRSRTYEAFFALILTAIMYFIIAEVMIRIVRFVQKRIEPRRRSEDKILAGIRQWE